jgi:acyl-lipid omega-3 desaturase
MKAIIVTSWSLFAWASIQLMVAGAFSTGACLRRPLIRATTAPRMVATGLGPTILVNPTEQELHRLQPELGESDLLSTATSLIRNDEPPKLKDVKHMLPKEAFHVDTATSLSYFAVDLLAVTATMGFLNMVVTSDLYHALPTWSQALAVAPLQVLTGFCMWCMWCIGHDAGHTTVSKNKTYGKAINRVVGEIAHSMICLTPFVPWAKSHLKHHMGHNHLTRDYSHQWFIREEREQLHPLIQLSHATRNLQLPILYLVYLLFGIPDGGHVLFYGRMWQNESFKEKCNAALSVVVSIATAGTLWMNMGTMDFAVVCLVPWLVMSFWLFMVTYLQHHSEDGVLYTDETWNFERGAFQTVDRDYGTWVNRASHHMMDGHLVHHLFFTRVPHYRLEEATTSLHQGMADRGQDHLIKTIDTPHFSQEIVKQFNENWFFVDENRIVRK